MLTRSSLRSRVTKSLVIGIVGLLLLMAWQMSSTAAFANGKTSAIANLQHTPTGTANLYLSSDGHDLTVTISLVGLAPKSTHPAHIHAGICTSNGPILYPLKNVVANDKGQASTTTVIASKDPLTIPATGWYINVHNGPTLKTANQAAAIACGAVSNPDGANSVLTFLGPTPNANQHATGFTSLKLKGDDLVVTITVSGLVPNSKHAAHIHAGNCFDTHKVLYDLSPLVADGHGNVTKTVSFEGVSSIPSQGWDVNVHFSTNLSTQTGYDPILCGNVTR